jgi:hypothetical protein
VTTSQFTDTTVLGSLPIYDEDPTNPAEGAQWLVSIPAHASSINGSLTFQNCTIAISASINDTDKAFFYNPNTEDAGIVLSHDAVQTSGYYASVVVQPNDYLGVVEYGRPGEGDFATIEDVVNALNRWASANLSGKPASIVTTDPGEYSGRYLVSGDLKAYTMTIGSAAATLEQHAMIMGSVWKTAFSKV